jgi:hypothetical protein
MITLTIVYVFFVVLFASFLQTLTGFGYALAAAPLLALAINPKDVVMLVLFTGLLVKTVMAWHTRHEGRFSDIILMFIASIAGALPGAFVMSYISNDSLKILIGIVLVVVTVLMYRRVTVRIENHRIAQAIVGLNSGFLASTTSLNGPPIVLYYMNEEKEKETIRANLARYFVLGNSASLVLSYFLGTLNVSNLATNVVVSIPALLIGFWIGEKVFAKVDGQMFRKVALGVISVSGMVSLGSGLWNWLH